MSLDGLLVSSSRFQSFFCSLSSVVDGLSKGFGASWFCCFLKCSWSSRNHVVGVFPNA